ncbi:MAG: flagellar basal body-associated FliL family protein [Methylococcaceae bacterium]|nr:flagellar basal body-associated FliL family protein [Methylococcaceae bacterium]MCI0733577.1 flagellar basal body-associated FliL family protein [Methylococcaceae bacterium]
MGDDDLDLGQKKSSKMYWIIASSVLTLFLLVIGTLYAMGRIQVPEFMTAERDIADPAESVKAGESIYYPLAPFTVNFRQGEGTRFLQVTMTALVESQDAIGAMQKHEPVIRNNLLLLLGGQDPAGLRTREGKEALRERVHKELQTILEQRTGGKGIEEIFFTGFIMQ